MNASPWGKANFWVNVFIAIFTLTAVIVAGKGLKEYFKTNRAEARAQLYEAERSITDLETAHPELLRIYVEVAPNTRAEEFVRQLMAIAFYGDPKRTLPPPLASANSAQLYTFIWGAESYTAPEAETLRKLYIHCERYIYHLHNGFDLYDENFIERGEWEAWRGLLGEIGANPVCLSAVYSAEKNKFFSRDFAKEIQEALRDNPIHEAAVKLVYPQLLLPTWPENFPEY